MTEIKRGICAIQSNDCILGTGFYIGNGRIITAVHVVENQEELEAVFMEIDGEVHNYKVEPQTEQPDIDISILSVKADDLLESVIINYDFSKVLVGSLFCTYGYPGEKMSRGSRIDGKVLNAHDGFQIADYNIDLEVTEGILEDYSGLSGAPVIIEERAVGICTYQDKKQLEMIEFHKYKEELQGCLDSEISQNQQWVSNMPNISDSEIFIRNSYPRSAIKSLILDGDINGIIIIKGSNGIGKTIWTELLQSDDELCVLGKYFIRRQDDTYSSIYRKSEDALYEWLCDVAVKFGKERIEVEPSSSYGKRLKSVKKILNILNKTMEAEGKYGLLCIDGLDEFLSDDPHIFESFCSYFAGIKLEYLYIIFTVTDEQILPMIIRSGIQKKQIFELPCLEDIQVRSFLLEMLNVPGIQEHVDKLVEKTEGHPLYLHYLIEAVKNMDTAKELESFVEEIPAYGGNIHTYYDFRWFELMKEEDQITCAAYLSAIRRTREKQNFLEMVPQEKRIVFDLALNKMGGLLQQGDRLSFFHSSFQQYVIERTKYFQEGVHHALAEYCRTHLDNEYGVTQLLYHLSCGNIQDRKECVMSCNQKWMDKCTQFDVEIEEMLYDMRTVLELCCIYGDMAQLVDKLLLMQRAEVRYNDMFVRFAVQAALAEIALDHPQKAITYLYRSHCLMADYENLFVCLVRMVEKGRKDCAEELCQHMESAFIRKIQDRGEVLVEEFCYLIRGYQLLAYADEGEDYYYYVKKIKIINELIFSSRPDGQTEKAFLQATTDYMLWSTGEVMTKDKMKEYGLTMNQKFFDIWLLTVAGTANLTNLLGKKEKSYEKLLDEILAEADLYEWNDLYTNAYLDACMIRREYAIKVPESKLHISEKWEVESLCRNNDAEIDSSQIYYLFVLYRNKSFAGEKYRYKCKKEDWGHKWESKIIDCIRFVGNCYGIGLRGKERETAEQMKRFLTEETFSFNMRTNFKDAYRIPEQIMEYLMTWISQFFLILYPEDTVWFTDYVLEKADDQFGVYYESYFRIMMSIAKTFLKWTPNEEVPATILKKIYLDITLKVANRYERTVWLLQLVDLMARSKCVELAKQAYQEMLHGSMGPWWYKEAQFSLLEGMLNNMQEDMIQPQLTDNVMAVLDAASGGMTFERYIRTTKEDVLAILWKRRQYNSVLNYVQVQLFPGDWQAADFSDYEPVDRKNGITGNYRVAKCIFPQRLVHLIIADEQVPDIYRWIFSEIFLLVERRHMEDYAKVQAQILNMSGKNKKRYIDRIVEILLCDTGSYYFTDLLKIYSGCFDESDFQIIVEMIKEVTGKSIEVPKSEIKTVMREVDSSIKNKSMSSEVQKEQEEIIVPGTWGTKSSKKWAEKLWEEAEKEEERGNHQRAAYKYKEMIEELEKGGWSVWSAHSSEKGKQAIHKIVQLSDGLTDAFQVLKKEIVWPKYDSRWHIVDELLKMLVPELSKEEMYDCYQAVLGHYREMITIPDNLEKRYKQNKYYIQSEKEAFFALLLQFTVLPDPYISQKSMEMLSWLVQVMEEELDKLIEYCFFDELEIAEICSSLCVKMADTRNAILKKELERVKYLAEKILKCPWMIVRGNMYLVLKQYCDRSNLLKQQYQQVISKLMGANMTLENRTRGRTEGEPDTIPKNIEILLDEKMCMPLDNLKTICRYASKKRLHQIWLLFSENTLQKKLSEYGERLSAGYHNGNLRKVPWRRKWYEEINKLDYHIDNEVQLIELLNGLRRVNCHFPNKDIQALRDQHLFYIVKNIFDSRNVLELNKVFGQELFLTGFQAVNLKNNVTEILTLRTFMVPEYMENKKCVMAILENHTDIYANMYPFEQVKQDLSGVKELSLQNHPGCMIGMNISGRILNHNVLRNLGIGDRDRKERVLISERKWENHMEGWPNFFSISGWINIDKLKLPLEYRLITFAELENVEKGRQWMFLDNETHSVTFI